MANRTVSVLLKAEVGSYVSSMAKAAMATESVGKSAETTGSKFKKSFDIAGRGAMLLGVGVAGALVGVVTKSMEFEKSMSAVQAATGATVGTMGQLRAAAIKAGADTSFSATEAANGITEMAKAGVSAKDIMGGGLTGALALAAAGQIDVGEAAGIASTAMTQFNLKGAQIPHVADLLAAGAGKAMGSVDDLGMALNQAGLVASAAGLSIEETTGTLAAFASAGLLGSDAGTSLKTMLQKLQAPSIQAAGVMKQYGINVYDSSGNMLSMAGMAGQLKDHLGGLTQEQRNSALATIFGSDAVRAATVLYNQGTQGIDAWTKKVNDAGYAAKQAAALQDNLAGDLEKLGGSFDTLSISLGSGAQGPFRMVVEALTNILNVAGSLVGAMSAIPGPVWLAVAALVGIKVLGGPLANLVKGIGFAFDVLSASVKSAGGPMAAIKGSMSGMAASFTPMNLGIGAAIMLLPALTQTVKTLTGNYDGAAAAQRSLTDALIATNGVIDESVRKNAQQQIVSAGLVHVLSQAGVSGKDAIDGLLGNAAAQDRVNAALGSYITTAMGANGVVSAASTDAGAAKQKYDELATALGMSKEEAALFADAATGAAGATDASGTAAAMAAPKVDSYQSSLEDASKAAGDAKTQTDLFKLSLDILTGKTVSLIQVESAFQEAVASATGATKGLQGSVADASGGLNLHSEAGRKASGVLLNVRDTANTLISTMIQQGATTAQVTAADARMRDGFIKSAMQMGFSRAAAEKLANQILGIPKDRNTKITADTGEAADSIAAIQKAIDKLHGKDLKVTVTETPGGYHITQAGGVGGQQTRATGGPIFGPGTGTSDTAGLFRLSNGEHVWTAKEVAKAGGHSAVKAMRNAVLSDTPGLATGGPAGIHVGIDDTRINTVMSSLNASIHARNMAAASVGGGAGRWLGTVLSVLAALHQSSSLAGGILKLIQAESGGNPRAINLTDSNARAGHPSQGLMQTIPSTFYAYAGPYGGRGITDPFANIYAGVNYALHRYGASMLAGGGRHSRGGAYVGYFGGVDSVPHDDLYRLHAGERVMTREENAAYTASREMSGRSGGAVAGSSGGTPNVTVNARVFVGSQEITDIARVEAEVVMASALDIMTSRGRNNP